MRTLTPEMIRKNSGEDLWNYLFENQSLPRRYEDDDVEDDESVVWLKSQLLSGEQWAYFKENEDFVFTDLARVFNVKHKRKTKVLKYVNVLRVNISTQQFNLNKKLKEQWNIDLEMDELCDEALQMIKQLQVGRKKDK